jgi:predicted RNA-binding protein
MCEANVYFLDKDGNEKLLLESVDKVVPTDEGLFLENIFSQRKIVKAKIKEMELVEHRIIIEKV